MHIFLMVKDWHIYFLIELGGSSQKNGVGLNQYSLFEKMRWIVQYIVVQPSVFKLSIYWDYHGNRACKKTVISCKKTRYQMVSNSCDMINISLKVKDSTAPCIHCRYRRSALCWRYLKSWRYESPAGGIAVEDPKPFTIYPAGGSCQVYSSCWA